LENLRAAELKLQVYLPLQFCSCNSNSAAWLLPCQGYLKHFNENKAAGYLVIGAGLPAAAAKLLQVPCRCKIRPLL
jgi:hypothetical protein